VNATSTRQHVYLNAEERDGLERLADAHATSLSYVMRMALRALLGLPVPHEFRRQERDAQTG
jgi:hypothetical protein